METFAADGSVVPAAGTLTVFSPPSGPGVRVDTYGRPGPGHQPAVRLAAGQGHHPRARIVVSGGGAQGAHRPGRIRRRGCPHQHRLPARAAVRQPDPVGLGNDGFPRRKLPELAAAALSHQHDTRVAPVELYPGEEVLRAQLAGTVVEVAPEGAEFGAGDQLVVLEAMKMQHVLVAPDALRTVRNLVAPGQVVGTGDPLLVFTRTGAGVGGEVRHRRSRSRPVARRPRRGRPPASAHPGRGPGRRGRQAAQARVAAPPGRTSPIWSMPAASSNTARWPLPRSAAGAPKRT